MNKKHLYTLILVVLVFLVSCSGKDPAQDSSSPEPASYPVEQGESGYPVTQPEVEEESGYPISENEPALPQGPEFRFDRPVTANDEFVAGTGPANVPIILISVSEVGAVLSETVIDDVGVFQFDLEEPLVSGHTIGIQLGDIENTEFSESDFQYSDTYYERPLVGILFDMLVVE
jgi:hypothetical protein